MDDLVAHGRGKDGRAGRPGGAVDGRRHRRAPRARAARSRAPAGAGRDLGRREHGGVRRRRLAPRLPQVVSAGRRVDHRERVQRRAARRKDRRADAADLGRRRRHQSARRGPASRAAHSRGAAARRAGRRSRPGEDARRSGGVTDRDGTSGPDGSVPAPSRRPSGSPSCPLVRAPCRAPGAAGCGSRSPAAAARPVRRRARARDAGPCRRG